MACTIAIPADLYKRLANRAARIGQPVERLGEELLTQAMASEGAVEAPGLDQGLDWATASPEEIIADLRASRVEAADRVS
jgi:hypothetical protein